MNTLEVFPKGRVTGKIIANEQKGYFEVYAPTATLINGILPTVVDLNLSLRLPLGTFGLFAPTNRLQVEGIQVYGFAHSSEEDTILHLHGGTSTVQVESSEAVARLYIIKIARPKVLIKDSTQGKSKEHPDELLSRIMMPRRPMNIMKRPVNGADP
jgi:hypothetical protein